MRARLHHWLMAAGLALGLSAPSVAVAAEIKFAVTDVVGLENLQREWGPFQKSLQDRTGLKFQFFPVPNRTAAVEAMNAKRVDVVLTGPAEYVVFRTRTQSVPVVALARADYFANIVVKGDSPYQTPTDLRGQKVGFGAIGSTSRHLGPMQLLADHGVNPRTDIQAQHLSTSVLLEALKRGDLPAAGMNFTDFTRLRERNPDMGFRIIARSGDLPMDVLLAGPHVDQATIGKLREAFAKHGTEMIDSILAGGDENKKFKGMHWVTTVKDEDYNVVRRMYATIGQTQFSEFVGN